jgi:hypothetical protein
MSSRTNEGPSTRSRSCKIGAKKQKLLRVNIRTSCGRMCKKSTGSIKLNSSTLYGIGITQTVGLKLKTRSLSRVHHGCHAHQRCHELSSDCRLYDLASCNVCWKISTEVQLTRPKIGIPKDHSITMARARVSQGVAHLARGGGDGGSGGRGANWFEQAYRWTHYLVGR